MDANESMMNSELKTKIVNKHDTEGKIINSEKPGNNQKPKIPQNESQNRPQLLLSPNNDAEMADARPSNAKEEKYDGWKRFYLPNSVGEAGGVRRSRLLASKTVLMDTYSQKAPSQDLDELQPRRKKLGKCQLLDCISKRLVPHHSQTNLVAKKMVAQNNVKDSIIPPVRIVNQTDQSMKTPMKSEKTPVKAKKTKQTKPKTPRSTPIPIWVGKPDEKLEGGWPDGWVKKVFARKGGVSKGQTDRYWFSPKTEKKLRSIVEVKRFTSFLKECDGDEDVAYKKLKGK